MQKEGNKINISKELSSILASREGYRNENFRGMGTSRVEKIILFEIRELCNSDVLDFMGKRYKIDKPTFKTCVRHIQKMAIENFGKKEAFGLWLTTRDGALRNYCDEGENIISKYALPKNSFPISDLGDEGALFVLPVPPDQLEISEESVFLPTNTI